MSILHLPLLPSGYQHPCRVTCRSPRGPMMPSSPATAKATSRRPLLCRRATIVPGLVLVADLARSLVLLVRRLHAVKEVDPFLLSRSFLKLLGNNFSFLFFFCVDYGLRGKHKSLQEIRRYGVHATTTYDVCRLVSLSLSCDQKKLRTGERRDGKQTRQLGSGFQLGQLLSIKYYALSILCVFLGKGPGNGGELGVGLFTTGKPMGACLAKSMSIMGN